MGIRKSAEIPNNYILVILDSCRYDSFLKARPAISCKLGQVERRWSYASWTAPSLYNFVMGLMPHASPKGVFASEYYKRDFLKYSERLGIEGMKFESLVPQLNLPFFLKTTLGYSTHAMMSLPVLNPSTILNFGFDTYVLMEKHNDMRAMLRRMEFSRRRPCFYLLNVGETHYPYALPDEPPEAWPRLSGVHGVFKHLDDQREARKAARPQLKFFNQKQMRLLRRRQIEAVRYVDSVIGELIRQVPDNTYITVTSDHGELFGEDGYFGHGPVQHPKVFEVPFVEGKVR